MIGFLRGSLIGAYSDYVILDVNGVGYKVFLPLPSIAGIMALEGEISLFISTVVKEDSISLYGFESEDDQNIFEKLLSVSGLGVKSAMAALSSLSAGEIVSAVINENTDVLSQIPNVGKKTAQRMILELKDKFTNINLSEKSSSISKDATIISESVEVLVSLGYSRAAARKAVDAVYSQIEVKDTSLIIKKSLSILSKGL